MTAGVHAQPLRTIFILKSAQKKIRLAQMWWHICMTQDGMQHMRSVTAQGLHASHLHLLVHVILHVVIWQLHHGRLEPVRHFTPVNEDSVQVRCLCLQEARRPPLGTALPDVLKCIAWRAPRTA